jgi:hypothetical protein
MSGADIGDLFLRMKMRGDPGHPTAHSDPSAQGFYAAAAAVREQLRGPLAEALRRRGWTDSFHLLDLSYRAANLLNIDRIPWPDFFSALCADAYSDLVATRNVATFVPERYHGLAVVVERLYRVDKRPVRVADWGCATNLGLRYTAAPEVLLEDAVDPRAGTGWLRRALGRDPVPLADPVGVDTMNLTDEDWRSWAAACAYTSSDTDDPPAGVVPRRVVLDVGRPFTRSQVAALRADVVHCSMISNQLSTTQYRALLRNAAAVLPSGGLVVELVFIRQHMLGASWNTATRVRVRDSSGALGKPLTWLSWESSRCQAVRPGPDFQAVEEALGAQRVR